MEKKLSLQKWVFTGPESTGKTTLSRWAAQCFGGAWVGEYARDFLQQTRGVYTQDDLLTIARAQLQAERQAAQYSQLLFCDTDLTVIWVWYEHKFGNVHPEIEHLLLENVAQGYFLLKPDLPWKPDPLRETPDGVEREMLFIKYKKLLKRLGASFQIVAGNTTCRKAQITETLTFHGITSAAKKKAQQNPADGKS